MTEPEAPRVVASAGLSGFTVADLERELERRRESLARLQARREAVQAELAAVESEIATLSGSAEAEQPEPAATKAHRRTAPRSKNSLSLAQAMIVEVEPGESVAAAELAKRILRSGYETHSADFTKIVAQALARDERFKRTGRGMYSQVAASGGTE